MKAAVFYNITLEMTHHNFCHMLQITQSKPGMVLEGTTQGCDQQEVGSLGAIIETVLFTFSYNVSRRVSEYLLSNHQVTEKKDFLGVLPFLSIYFTKNSFKCQIIQEESCFHPSLSFVLSLSTYIPEGGSFLPSAAVIIQNHFLCTSTMFLFASVNLFFANIHCFFKSFIQT